MTRLFLLSFIAGLGLSAAALHRAGGRLERNYISVVHSSEGAGSARNIFSDIPGRYVDYGTTATDDVRPKRELWAVSGFAGMGIGLRAFDHPELLQTFYPNYPDPMRKDDALLSRYFDPARSFDTTLPATPILYSNRFKTRYVRAPSTGCLEIFGSYGADTILFGSSEMSYSLIPHAIGERLAVPGRANRVLPCGRDSQLAPTVRSAADWMSGKLRETKRAKAEYVIYGYSYWLAFTRSEWRRSSGLPEQENGLRTFASSRPGGEPHRSVHVGLKDFFPPLEWVRFFGFNIFDAQHVYEKNLLIEGSMKGIHAPAGSPQQVNFFTDRPIENDFVAETAANAKLTVPHLDGSDDTDCEMGQAASELDAAIASMLDVGRRVYLYVPPVTPLAEKSAPACYTARLGEMLAARRRHNVFVLTGGWPEYGMEWTDYVFARDMPGSYTFDLTHLNAGGAAKVTERIVSWIHDTETAGRE